MSEIHTVLSNPDLINNQKEDLVNEIESTVVNIHQFILFNKHPNFFFFFFIKFYVTI